MKLQIKAVAFDMDGLMFDTESVYYQVGTELMRRRGYEYTPELCQAVMGTPPKASFSTMIRWYSLNDTWEELQKESDEIFLELIKNGVNLMPGLQELLAAIDERRLPKCICTSSSRALADAVLATHNMAPQFDFILTAENIMLGKPNPEVYLKAAIRFGIEPASMMVLEDSVFGTQAAHGAGAFTIAVISGHNKTQQFPCASMIAKSLDAHNVIACLP